MQAINGLIPDPIIFHDTDTLETVAQTKQQKGYKFSGFPIVNAEGKLVGI